ncbi:MAG: Ferrous iron transport protein [Candidatus Frackibacter sp. T328-2]|nr:MAG: Ferrous iron transport protein [Candidatus Frackibacter sp. T328-2]
MNLGKKKVLITTMMMVVLMVGLATNAYAFKEYPIGEEKIVKQMKIAAVYFQSVPMKPEAKAGLSENESDIHIEADIHAVMNNPYGFGFGAWVPNLTVDYKLENLDTGEVQEGSFMPMVASDGPHYGANIDMMGIGNYKLTYTIYSPAKQDFLQHVDKTTGVDKRFWKKPIKVSWDFTYTGNI